MGDPGGRRRPPREIAYVTVPFAGLCRDDHDQGLEGWDLERLRTGSWRVCDRVATPLART